jgi:hypothetical protein
LAFFKQLEELGRKKTGMPDWLVKLLEGKFLDNMGKQLQQGINSLAGISDPFLDIKVKAADLRTNLLALAAATHMSAQQVADGMTAIAGAEAMAKQQAINGVLDKLFGYLKDDPKYASQIVALKKQEVDLEFEIYKAQLMAAGIWEKDKGIWEEAHQAALAAVDAAGRLTSAFDQAAAIQQDKNMVAGYDLVKAQQDAANKFRDLVRGLVDANRKLLTGSASSLSPQDKFTTALADYQRTLTAAKGGNSQAMADVIGVRDTLLQVAQQYFAGGAGQGLSGGYDQLLKQTLQDFATLALSPDVEQKTLQDLISRATAKAADAAAQTHADLVGLRQDMVNLLQQNHIGNVIGGPSVFPQAPYVDPSAVGPASTYQDGGYSPGAGGVTYGWGAWGDAPPPPQPPSRDYPTSRPTGSSDGQGDPQLLSEVQGMRSEIAAQAATVQKQAADIAILAADAEDEKAWRNRQRVAS